MAARMVQTRWKDHGHTLRGTEHVTRAKNATWFVFSHGFTGHRLGPGYLFVKLSHALADAGFSSLRFDFAGSGESDGAFPEMTIASMQSNLRSAVRHVKKTYAPKNVILIGHSLGGMIAALCSQAVKPDGFVLLAPVGDPHGLIVRRKTILEAGPNKRGFYENGPHEMSLGLLGELKAIDPVASFAHASKSPLLLMQGDSDASISEKESYLYVTAARKAAIPTEYHILKNADHNFSSVAHFNTIFTVTTNWAKEHFL